MVEPESRQRDRRATTQRQPASSRDPWPGQMRTIYGDHQRFVETYFSTSTKGRLLHRRRLPPRRRRLPTGSPGASTTCINVSGHRMGTAEVESGARRASQGRPRRPWSAIPHDIKGQGIYCYVTLMEGRGVRRPDELKTELAAGCARRSARSPRPTTSSSRRGPAEDPLRQDHAAHPAQDCRGRLLESRRYFHVGRAGSGGRPDREPPEPAIETAWFEGGTALRRNPGGVAVAAAPFFVACRWDRIAADHTACSAM